MVVSKLLIVSDYLLDKCCRPQLEMLKQQTNKKLFFLSREEPTKYVGWSMFLMDLANGECSWSSLRNLPALKGLKGQLEK